jgi:predicted nucleotidyltransferase component of viral defense system
MIPRAYLQAWRNHAPWPDLRQVEQDLIISRTLCDLFQSPALSGKIAFRGGTAIHKLLFDQPLRYSEDIDLVQITPGPVGEFIDGARAALRWLGAPKRFQAGHSMHLVYTFEPEEHVAAKMKLKVEINTREHQPFAPTQVYTFRVDNPWYRSTAEIISYDPDELFGTKLRALLQRDKNRDLFDLGEGLQQLQLDRERVVAAFEFHRKQQETTISRANAEERMLRKLRKSLTDDLTPLLPAHVEYSASRAIAAFGAVWTELIGRLPGEPWKRSAAVIEALRESGLPDLLK